MYSCRNLHSMAHNLPVYTKIHTQYVATHYFNGKLLFSWKCLSKQESSLQVEIRETWQNDGNWRIILYLHNIHFNAIESFEVFVCTICCFCWRFCCRFCCGWWMEVMTISSIEISMKATTLNEFQINQSGQHITYWPYYMQWSQWLGISFSYIHLWLAFVYLQTSRTKWQINKQNRKSLMNLLQFIH